jgi:A/G-specific adenine glycosylase
MEICNESIKVFQKQVMSWWKINARDLPWRKNPIPYNVLVSEFMLQQTQVSRVVSKYPEFLNAFPTLETLASADTKQVLRIWSGLGYNRRAVWLRDAARQILEKGKFPQTVEELNQLKGIGPYTSRSILIFAFNKDIATVDTNIRRVLISSGFADEDMSKSQLQKIADRLLLRGRSRDWHNALMDYGSMVLTASSTGVAPLTRQPEFPGSIRQLRGAIIRILTCTDSLSLDEILHNLNKEQTICNDVEEVLDALISEKLIERTNEGEYRIAEC